MGMYAAHSHASGMGGMRAAGDLVARMEMTKSMRLQEAKTHVAGRLGVSPPELSDPVVMNEVRRELRLGRVSDGTDFDADPPTPMESKMRIAALLDIPVASAERFSGHLSDAREDSKHQ